MSGGKGGGGSQPIVVGYFYYLSMHMILCHGPVDSISKIWAGSSVLWSGNQVTSGTLAINQPNLFGGKLKEGGFVGSVDLQFGFANQTANSYLAAHTGQSQTPASRGVVGIVWEDVMYSANSSRPKPWNIEATRLPRPLFHNPSDVDIGGHANGSYLIAECLTNEEWGLGYLESDLEQSSFLLSAATLKTENFKLSVLWQNSTSLEDFIGVILQHINGNLYVDPSTGKFVLKLIRNDYDYNTLQVFDESNVLDVLDYSIGSSTDLINQLTVKWVDEVSNDWASLTEHNTAVRELQGAIVSVTREYPAIPDEATARMVALRDISVLSQPLASVRIEVNREGADLRIGDVIRWDWPDYGIIGMPLRVIGVGYGLLEKGKIVLDCVEDIFGADSAKFGAPTGSEWVDPNPAPQPSLATAAFNATYYDTLTEANNNNVAISVDKYFGYEIICAAQPDPMITAYELWANAYQTTSGTDSTNYKFRGGNLFTPYAVLSSDLIQEVQSTLPITNVIGIEDVRVGTVLLCGSELMELISIASDNTSITVWRGILDTTPAPVKAGSQIWFYEDYKAYPPLEWADGTEVSNKVLPMTTQGVLDINVASPIREVIQPRWYLPYPPGNLKINGLSYPTSAVTGDLTITWSHRDRVQQDNVLIHQDETDIGPEAGVTYTVRVFTSAGTAVHTAENIETNSYTYTANQAAIDLPGDLFYVAVTAVREGLSSTTAHFAAVSRTGAAVPALPANNDTVVYESHPSFGAYIPSSLALVTQVSITGLQAKAYNDELSASEFAGKNIVIQWGNNVTSVFSASNSWTQDDLALWLKDYEVKVKDTSNVVLRTEYVTTPDYTYFHSFNTADGVGGPRRAVTFEIRARDHNNFLSAPTVATFSNPAPAEPTFTLSAGTEATYIDVVPPADKDLAGYVVYRAVGNSLTPSTTNIIYEGSESKIVIPGDSGTQYSFAVAAFDTFGSAELLPTAVQSISLLTSNVDIWTFTGLDFRSNYPATNKASWSAGTAHKNGGAGIAISAGDALWSSGILFIYYDGSSATLSATTDLSVAVSGVSIIATYKGGNGLTVGNGKALFDGSLLLAGSIGANQLVANSAIITNALQVATGIINDAHITDLDASKVTATDLSVLSQNAGTITAGVLQSSDSLFVIDLNNKFITIS